MTYWKKRDCKEFLENLFALFGLCAIFGFGARIFLLFAGF